MLLGKLVLLQRIELWTSPLPRECSTSELQQRRARVIRPKTILVQGQSGRFLTAGVQKGMADKNTPRSAKKQAEIREDRLKAALKVNLARRKAQARARSGDQAEQTGKTKG